MSRTKTLRLPESHPIPSGVLQQITQVINPTRTKIYKDKLTHDVNCELKRKNHEERRDIFCEAFEFLIEAHPPENYSSDLSRKQLIDYVKHCREECQFTDLRTQKEMKSVLTAYLQKLLAVLTDVCKWKKPVDFNEARDWLNEAEQYLLMQKPVDEIATVIPIELEQTVYVLTWDRAIPFYGESFLNDLQTIKKFNAPITPEWFNKLDAIEKSYISKLTKTICSSKSLAKEIENDTHIFSEKWKKIKFDLGSNLPEILQLIRDGIASQRIPQSYHSLPARYKVFIQYTSSSDEVTAYIKHIQKFAKNLNSIENFKSELTTITQLPLWYATLPEIQQHFLRKILSDVNNVADAIKQLPSRARRIPALPNARGHNAWLWDANGKLLGHYDERKSSSHWVPRDVLNLGREIIDKHVQNNINTFRENMPSDQHLLYGTLISSVKLIKWISEYSPKILSQYLQNKLPPDHQLHENLLRNIRMHPEFESIFNTNHSLNIARIINSTSRSSADIMRLIESAKNMPHKSQRLIDLLNVYDKLLDSGIGSSYITDYICRELCFSTLDQLVAVMSGVEMTISCVSGKDRVGISHIHTVATLIFNTMYNKWPIHIDAKRNLDSEESQLFINASERLIFVHIFCCIFLSGHHQEHASLGAKGVKALQNCHIYLPQDIINEIDRRQSTRGILQEESDMATYNELHKLVKKPADPNPKLVWQIAASACSFEQAQKFINTLYKYIHQCYLFRQDFASNEKYASNPALFFQSTQGMPVSPVITCLRNLLKENRYGERRLISPQTLLADIFETVSRYVTIENNPYAKELCDWIGSYYDNDAPQRRSIGNIIETMEIAYRKSLLPSDEKPGEPCVNEALNTLDYIVNDTLNNSTVIKCS